MRNELKELRLAKDINATQLAELCGVSRQTIHSIESGKYVPSVELALRLARQLKTSVDKIFILEDRR